LFISSAANSTLLYIQPPEIKKTAVCLTLCYNQAMRPPRYEIEEGVYAHIPEPLPPTIKYTRELSDLISKAERSLALLNGAAKMFKHIEVMTWPSMMKEAVASVRLEGTRTTFDEMVEDSAQPSLFEKDPDRQEAWNYWIAMKLGFFGMERLPLSSRLIRDVHKELLKGVRGEKKTPGQFRTGQNRIGGIGYKDARYIPPPHIYLPELMGELEQYMNAKNGEPELIRCALIHCHFESVHPFWDGNGRVGRLLISLYLHDRGLLEYPILNMSQYFEDDKEGYYEALEKASLGDNWDWWVSYFLNAVWKQAEGRYSAIHRLSSLYETTLEQLKGKSVSVLDLKAVDIVFERLSITANGLREHVTRKSGEGISLPTSYNIIKRLMKIGFLHEAPKKKRPKLYYSPRLKEFWDSV
jgi:Fic family protein